MDQQGLLFFIVRERIVVFLSIEEQKQDEEIRKLAISQLKKEHLRKHQKLKTDYEKLSRIYPILTSWIILKFMEFEKDDYRLTTKVMSRRYNREGMFTE